MQFASCNRCGRSHGVNIDARRLTPHVLAVAEWATYVRDAVVPEGVL